MTHRSGARLGHLRWPRSRRAHPCTVAAGSDAPPVRTAHLRGRRSLARTPSRA
jgi:hypothetical protein